MGTIEQTADAEARTFRYSGPVVVCELFERTILRHDYCCGNDDCFWSATDQRGSESCRICREPLKRVDIPTKELQPYGYDIYHLLMFLGGRFGNQMLQYRQLEQKHVWFPSLERTSPQNEQPFYRVTCKEVYPLVGAGQARVEVSRFLDCFSADVSILRRWYKSVEVGWQRFHFEV